MNRRSTFRRWRSSVAVALAAIAVHGLSAAADIDIYATSGSGVVPNVMFFLDNTSNWSRQQQAWLPQDSWDKCKNLDADAVRDCKAAIDAIFYVGRPASDKRPWENGFKNWNSNEAPAQGSVELRAIRFVLKQMVCDVVDDPTTPTVEKPLAVNVGLSLFTPDKGSERNSGDAVTIVYHAVKRLLGPSDTGTCKQLLDKLELIDQKIQAPDYKAPSDANLGAMFYELFKYYGGYTNPTLAAGAESTAGSPVGATGYGDRRFSKLNTLDDPDAFDDATRLTYKSPISEGGACGNNYVVLVGNTYPNQEANAGPTRFQGLNYTPPTLSLVTSDVSRYADEWSYFLSNTDVNEAPGTQPVYTYALNVYNDKEDIAQTKLLKSIAGLGGVGGSAYVEVGGDLYKLVKAFKGILLEVAAVDSVFTAATLPVSSTTQGTFLNQVFVGMFRPDSQFKPRWVGNVKQYELGLINGTLELVDAKKQSVVLTNSGFFRPQAESFWTTDSVFFENLKSGSPPSASDLPDGSIVEKGGVAQLLRTDNLQGATNRTVFTLPSSPPAANTSLSGYPFTTSNSNVTAAFSTEEIAWVRGEANVTTGPGAEEFVGSWKDGTTTKNLGTTGARHSIHGDVLHSRPLALNYGNGDVVVYYGSNDGFLRAVDGKKTGTTAGHELWSFVAPEHYAMLKRLRNGVPVLHLPETNSDGTLEPTLLDAEPKDYAFDGQLGSYVLYNTGGSTVQEAMLYATMRRGGKAVYAFDVTNKSDPKFAWKIDSSGDFSELAQTWSMAKPIVYRSTSGAPPVVVVMGGGYDVAEETNSANVSGTPPGNKVYFINGRTGALLAKVTTDYSVPADVTVVDIQNDGIPDRAYAIDVRGNVYRIDLPTTGNVLDPATWSGTTAVKIAALGGKAFYAVDVVVTSDFVAVLAGTGDREKPLLKRKIYGALDCVDANGSARNCEAFFMIKDTKSGLPPPATPFQPSDLAHIAKVNENTMLVEAVTPADASKTANGCYMTLAYNGEKVVNAPTTIGGVAYFGTNRPPPDSALSCRGNLGEAYAYKFPLFCKTPTSTKLVTDGLPPSPVAGIVTIDVNGKPTQIPFIIGGGQRKSPFLPEVPEPAVSPVRQRQFWYINNANR
jgi:type IV pilus assembly protein PilY1